MPTQQFSTVSVRAAELLWENAMADLTLRYSREVKRMTVLSGSQKGKVWLLNSVLGAAERDGKAVAYLEEEDAPMIKSMARTVMLSVTEEEG